MRVGPFTAGHLSDGGPMGDRCARLLEDLVGSTRAMCIPSCTSALELAAKVLDIGPGDEAIVPAYTFVSSALAFANVGAVPVFVDVRPDTLNLDERMVEAAIRPRARAIVVVHYGGVAA